MPGKQGSEDTVMKKAYTAAAHMKLSWHPDYNLDNHVKRWRVHGKELAPRTDQLQSDTACQSFPDHSLYAYSILCTVFFEFYSMFFGIVFQFLPWFCLPFVMVTTYL